MHSPLLQNLWLTFSYMTQNEKRQCLMLLVVSLANGLIQSAGVVSIMPFIALVAEPELLTTHPWLLAFNQLLGITDYLEALFVFGGISIAGLLLSNFFVVLNYGLSLYFFNTRGHRLSVELLKKAMAMSPIEFQKWNPSELKKRVFSDVDRVIIGSQMACLSIITDLVIFSVLFSLLLYVNGTATLLTIVALLMAFGGVYLFMSRPIARLGKAFSVHETRMHQGLQHAIDHHKEGILFDKQSYFLNQYSRPTETLYQNSSRYHLLQFIPMQLVELLVFSIILVLAGYLALSQNSTAATLTSISLYALAAYRIIPVFKSIFEAYEDITYGAPVLAELLPWLKPENHVNTQLTTPIALKHCIKLQGVSFQFEGNTVATPSGLDAEFPRGCFTCIVGPSGVGKSTTLDILMGLLSPSTGQVLIDDTPLLPQHALAWRRQLGYVPQRIQLLNDTVANNIAYGVESIDQKRVVEVAQLACIDHRISALPDGYQTTIGEGGHSLSGGEKQRIAIARALYHQPNVLIFDEASNELDESTEKQLITNIQALGLTLIFVSHKPSVAKMADHRLDLTTSCLKAAV